ncbi:hypothetical protein ACSBR2_004177 [Camellia fascicularis]
MSSSSHSYSKSEDQTTQPCCPNASSELKLYQAFIFSVPIFSTFILAFFFYLFYLCCFRRPQSRPASLHTTDDDDFSTSELGLKKEHREMLPIIIFKETFSVKDTQCSVCLADYQAEDRLQQIPACGHTFHTDCIDLWLATHTTCPLCRLSLIASAKASTEPLDAPETSSRYHPPVAAGDETRSHQIGNRTSEESWISQQCSGSGNGDERSLEISNGEERTNSEFVERDRHLEALN